MKYAWNVARSVIKARAQELGLFYDRKFDVLEQDGGNAQYQLKLDYEKSSLLCSAGRFPQLAGP